MISTHTHTHARSHTLTHTQTTENVLNTVAALTHVACMVITGGARGLASEFVHGGGAPSQAPLSELVEAGRVGSLSSSSC